MKHLVTRGLRAVLPNWAKRSVVHLGYQLEPDEFANFAHTYCIAPTMSAGLASIAARGFRPQTIVDIGAYEGGWTTEAKLVWPAAKSILIEANTAKLYKLKGLGEVHCALLGAEEGQPVQFNLMETGSSIFVENSPVDRQIETRTLSTLDALRLEIASPALLKIDAQGYELEILKGSTNTLPAFDAILLEIAVIEINKGAPLLHEVTAFMDRLGFAACEILELHRRPLDHALSQLDIFFVRKDSRLLSDTRYSA